MNLFLPGAIKSTGGGGYKPQQLPERVPHLKERTYLCGFPNKRGGRLTPSLKWHHFAESRPCERDKRTRLLDDLACHFKAKTYNRKIDPEVYPSFISN